MGARILSVQILLITDHQVIYLSSLQVGAGLRP